MPSVSSIIKKHWKVMMDNSIEMKNVFKKPSIVAYMRPKNLKDILVRSKLPPKRPSRVINGFGKCDSLLCTTHPFAPQDITKKQVCNYTNVAYDIKTPINCQTRNVIYKIICEKCPSFVCIGTPLSWLTSGWKATTIATNYINFSSFLWAFSWYHS